MFFGTSTLRPAESVKTTVVCSPAFAEAWGVAASGLATWGAVVVGAMVAGAAVVGASGCGRGGCGRLALRCRGWGRACSSTAAAGNHH